MSDNISDFITIIRNAYSAKKDTCTGKFSKLHLSIANILKQEGFIREVREIADERGHKQLELVLKYVDETPAITGIKRHSRPGRRVYYGHDDIPRVLGGLGTGILTTNKGILRDRDARRQKIGGEMICTVW
jgi:small subunit ribosomal protein S8